MRAGDGRDDGHAEPVAAIVAGPVAVDLLEWLKQAADLARRDDGAAVGDGEPGTAS